MTRALSAAHCIIQSIVPQEFSIKAGSSYFLDQEDPNAQNRILSDLIIHPEWHRPTIQNDIAILQWKKHLIFVAYVQSVVLPKSNHVVPNEKLAVSSGWRLTSTSNPEYLHVVVIPFDDKEDCNRSYYERITANMICAGFPQGDQDNCQGDSGGSLVYRSAGIFIQVGVVSWARGCAGLNAPSVYAPVPQFHKWIRENL